MNTTFIVDNFNSGGELSICVFRVAVDLIDLAVQGEGYVVVERKGHILVPDKGMAIELPIFLLVFDDIFFIAGVDGAYAKGNSSFVELYFNVFYDKHAI